MRRIRTITEDDMIAAFLQAEAMSPRFSTKVLASGEKNGLTSKQLISPDVTNDVENKKRKRVLGEIRGYGRNTLLFQDLPTEITWALYDITLGDILTCKYLYHSSWFNLSRQTSLVSVGAKNYVGFKEDYIGKNVSELIPLIESGAELPKIILLKTDAGSLTVFEGHTRITALANALNKNQHIDAIVGEVRDLKDWAWNPN